jgi:parvulin-like peptidyl-prolyl isomerase
VRAGPQRKRLIALVLGVALVVAFGAFAISGDIGEPSVPEGDVAVVQDAPDGNISQEEYDGALRQAAFNLQLRELPAADDPQFAQVSEAALSNVIQTRWVKGEAEERGIEVTERDVDQSLETVIDQQLGGPKGYEQFLKQSEVDGEPAFTEEDVRAVAELTAISNRLQEQALPQDPPAVPEEDVELYYEANIEQFQVPESRDVRVILNPDPGEIEQAMAALEQDDSPQSWEEVARKYSTDDATKGQGGLRRDVTEGQNEPALDEAIFSAPVGELVGPIEGESGTYLIQVEEVTPAETTPLDEVREQITQGLQQGLQTQAVDTFRNDFIQKWTSRTFCDEDVVIDLCANAPPAPEPCPIDDDSEREQADPATLDQGCPAPALPRNVVNPGTGAVFPGSQLPTLPQGPLKPPAPAQAGLPPGATPIGPGGAPVAPPAGAEGAAPAAP